MHPEHAAHTTEILSLYAVLGGLGIALMAGPLGCFVVWRRMAYFGDSLAHSALLGAVLGIVTGLTETLGILAVCSVFALLLIWLQHRRILATDTLLGILEHTALAAGLITAHAFALPEMDAHDYLFGDLVTLTPEYSYIILAGAVLVLGGMLLIWRPLLLLTLHEDLARAEGVRTLAVHVLFMAMITLVVALAVKVVGLLLMTAMLVIPAAAARQLANTPEKMAWMAAAIGGISTLGGLYFAMRYALPATPAIVLCASAIFTLLLPMTNKAGRRA